MLVLGWVHMDFSTNDEPKAERMMEIFGQIMAIVIFGGILAVKS